MGVETGNNLVERPEVSDSGCAEERLKELDTGSRILKDGHLTSEMLVTSLSLVSLSTNTPTRLWADLLWSDTFLMTSSLEPSF